MDNAIKIINEFEQEQLNAFNSNKIVLHLKELCLKLDLLFRTGISKLEDYNDKRCKKENIVHSGYLFFEVLYNNKVIETNEEKYGCLTWSDAVSVLKKSGKYKLFKWDEDNELLSEVEKTLEFLLRFSNKESLLFFINK